MLTLDEYKQLLTKYLDGKTGEEIRAQYERDVIFAAFIIKIWLEKKRKDRGLE